MTYLRRCLSTSETVMLESSVDRRMLLEVLQGIRGSAEAVGHFRNTVEEEIKLVVSLFCL